MRTQGNIWHQLSLMPCCVLSLKLSHMNVDMISQFAGICGEWSIKGRDLPIKIQSVTVNTAGNFSDAHKSIAEGCRCETCHWSSYEIIKTVNTSYQTYWTGTFYLCLSMAEQGNDRYSSISCLHIDLR